MADIVKAIEKEKEYLSYRMKGEEPFHLVDAIKDCGFETLIEYFIEKPKYYFGNLQFEIIEKKPSVCLAEVQRMMDEKVTGVLFVESDETFVFSGNTKEFNEEYCIENNIPIYYLHTGGGTIVSTAGDFSIGICVPDNAWVHETFILDNIKHIMSKYVNNVEVNGNDILIDGAKVCGSTYYKKNDMVCFVAHFSFNDNTELIENICSPVQQTYSLRRLAKQPSCIMGMTTSELKREVAVWLQATLF
jgi:hypothetical protein